MKTKEEIISSSLKNNGNYQMDHIIDEITEGLNNRVQRGYSSYEYVFWEGGYDTAMAIARHVATRLNDMGFYAQFGWRETTPNGNERPIVVVALERPTYVPIWKNWVFWFFVVLGTVLLSLIPISLILRR